MKLKDLEEQNYYEMLGLDFCATKRDIKAAYRELSRKYHPDSYNNVNRADISDETLQIFSLLTEAFHTLSDDDLRTKYDNSLEGTLPTWNSVSLVSRTRTSHNGNKYNLKTFKTFGHVEPRDNDPVPTTTIVMHESFIQKIKKFLFKKFFM